MRIKRDKKHINSFLLEICILLIAFFVPTYVNAAISNEGDSQSFTYTGKMQTFTAPYSGYYQLEGWGGQGYTTSGLQGGYGAYTTGVVRLQKNETIYIAVGAQGTGGATSNYSSWSNGGTGMRNDNKSYIGAGGASTNFTTVNKTLASITTSNLNQILLVAAGGGSSTYGYGGGWYGSGGAGGGIVGNNGISNRGGFASGGGGSQTAGGTAGNACNRGVFGAGASGAAAGGGGFYGGGCSWGSAGGGGSSYVANEKLLSYDSVVKGTYCYSCVTSSIPTTYTTNTTNVSATATAKYAKTGPGAAKVTLLYILSDEARLSSLNVSKGIFDQPFDKDTYTYNIVLDEDDYNIDISATALDSKATIVGEGNFNIPAKTTVYNLAVTAEDGTVATYTLNITRPPSSYKYLNGIKVNGEKVENFNPETLEYTVHLSYDQDEISLDALLGRPSQIIDGIGTFKIPTGITTKIIEVTSEDKKSVTPYKIHFIREHSSKLKSLEIEGYDLEPSFNRAIYEYEVNILSSDLSLKVNAIAYDEEAKIILDGFGYIKGTSTATITVKEPNSPDTVYKIKIVKGSSVEQIVYDFPYTGGFQEFTSPIDGWYKLETWGAQGYSVAGYIGGYGAYAVGATKIKKGETVYVNVGGAGVGGWRKNGFSSYPNGGIGNVGDRVSYVGAGGSSTNITTTRKNLVNMSANLNEILMVAAGGGSATWTSGNGWYGHGGAGGGIVGNKGGTKGYFAGGGGGTQTSGGSAGYSCNRGSFGKGANASSSGTGGGGGFYGGGCSWGAAGGGGSSYIANPKLQSYKDIPRVMYCYHCQTSSVETTATETTANYSSTPTSYYAKSGNGHARITLVAQLSKNNFLSEITTDKGTLDPTFDMLKSDYNVKLNPEDDTINIDAVLEDETATLQGTGKFDVPAGKTTFPITVTAENGDIRIYNVVVERDLSSNPYPHDIKIEGLIPTLCSVKDGYCKQTPSFNPDTDTYDMTVPSLQKKIEFIVEKGHKYQIVNGDGEVNLESGMNIITITVTAEDGEHIAIYTYRINRDMSGDNNIEKLEVIDPKTDINFQPEISEYFFSVPNNYTKVGLNVVLEDPKATYEIIGNENFKSGLNIVEILVTAQNGDQKTYTLNIYREQSGNTFLSSLEVSNDTEIFDLNPKFNKIISNYLVNVGNGISKVEIKAIPEHSLTTIAGDGEKNLKVGTNVFNITSTAEDGSVQIYQVSIVRAKNSDATLKTLDVLEGILSPVFQSTNLEYSVEVNPGITSLNLNVEPTASTSKYQIIGNYGFQVDTDNIVSIVVTAEDGTTNTYKIHVHRKASDNNYLRYLNTDKYDMTSIFNKEVEEYNITVENEVDKISVIAEPEDSFATLMGDGNYYLDVGNNDIFVSVSAEDGTVRTYTLHVFRKYNSNAYLSNLTTNIDIPFNQTFDKKNFNYTLTVGSDVEEIAVIGAPEVSTSKVTGNGIYQLVAGENKITLTVEAEDGSTNDYTLLVIKEKSNNANLSMIIAKESVLDPSFHKNKTDYVLKVIESVTNLTLSITPEDKKATYQVLGNEDFKIGENTVVIRVKAEDGTTKDYNLTVIRQESGTTSNRLEWLAINPGVLTPTFDKDTNYYEVEVPYNVTSTTLTGELEDKNATVTGLSTYNLNVGINVLSVQVTSVENIVRYYQVVVTRKANDEARLASLQVFDTNISPNFNKDIYQYHLSTTLTSLNIDAIPMDSNATVQIIGNNNLQLGPNQIVIRVTAHDKVTTKDYILNVEKEKSNNNNLKSLEVIDHSITPEFSKNNTVYYLNVQKDVDRVSIKAIPEDPNAIVEGDGEVVLTSSVTYASVTVTSESGNKKVYTVIILREKSTNNFLESLTVSSGELSPEFEKTQNNYTVKVPYEVENILVSGTLEDERSTVTGFGKHELQVGVNKVAVTVTAEDGSINTYYIDITKEGFVSSKLKSLSVQSYSLDQPFYKEVYDYNLSVNSEVDSLILNIVPEDPNATYRVVGNNDFLVGMNIIKIIVTDSLGLESTTYTLNVNKQNYSNTYLAYIYTSQGTLVPNFIKTTLDYTVNVGSEVDKIDVLADPEVSTNTVTGPGVYHLVPGDNNIELKVETPTGISRIYRVNIVREKKSKNHLLNLQVKVDGQFQLLTPSFNKDILEYSLDVPKEALAVEILGKAEEDAIVEGLGVKMIKSGTNQFQITVISDDGEIKIYKLTVNKEKSNNNHLTDIIPSVGELTPSFNYTKDEYSLVLDASASILSFDVVTEDPNAKVKGNEIQVIPDGLSKREIIVEAEDGSINTYTINVYKERTDDARLSNLEISGYTFNEVFDKDTYHYTVKVPNSKNVLLSSEVIATPIDSSATVTKTSSLVLTSTGVNIYTVVVTAKDGFTKQTYTISVEREKGSDSTLSKLEFDHGTLTPVFTPTTTEYTLMIPKGSSTINQSEVTAIPTDSDATVTIPLIYTYSDTNKVYEILVESPDGSSTTIYKINIELVESNNALLSSLSIDHGILTPAFDKEINSYIVELDSEVDELEISAIAEDENATITGTGKQPVVTGLNRYEVVVTAEDGTINTYIIEATRKISSNTNIVDIIPSSGTLSPSYDSEIDHYEVTVDEEVESIDFEVTLESNKAIVTGNKDNTLNYGKNEITITVTAEDGTIKEVLITVVREKKVTDIEVVEEILMDVGDVEVLDAIVLPVDATNKELEWTVLDNHIVTVEDGVVTALSLGDTTITVSSKSHPDVKKEIRVSVLNLKITSDVYDVRRDSIHLEEEEAVHNIVIGAEAKTTLDVFLSNLKNKESLIHFYDKDGNPITDITESIVATGMIVRLEYNTKVYDTAYIAVRGENTLDGRIDVDDLDLLDRQILGLERYPNDSLIFKVSDVVETEKIDVDDSDKVEQYVLGKIKTLND